MTDEDRSIPLFAIGVLMAVWILSWFTNPDPAGADAVETATATSPGVNRIVVSMNDKGEFIPPNITINVGDTVEFRNIGLTRHTVTDNPDSPTSRGNEILPEGAKPMKSGWIDGFKSYTYTFDTPGFYRYVCLPHENVNMIGTVTVN